MTSDRPRAVASLRGLAVGDALGSCFFIPDAMALLPLDDPRSAAASLGNGRYISAPDTVPFCLWIAAKHPGDFVSAFWDTACVGGDIDTTCAIVGGFLGARLGIEGIPAQWRERCEPLPDEEHV